MSVCVCSTRVMRLVHTQSRNRHLNFGIGNFVVNARKISLWRQSLTCVLNRFNHILLFFHYSHLLSGCRLPKGSHFSIYTRILFERSFDYSPNQSIACDWWDYDQKFSLKKSSVSTQISPRWNNQSMNFLCNKKQLPRIEQLRLNIARNLYCYRSVEMCTAMALSIPRRFLKYFGVNKWQIHGESEQVCIFFLERTAHPLILSLFQNVEVVRPVENIFKYRNTRLFYERLFARCSSIKRLQFWRHVE